jgi:hypothetical protein
VEPYKNDPTLGLERDVFRFVRSRRF